MATASSRRIRGVPKKRARVRKFDEASEQDGSRKEGPVAGEEPPRVADKPAKPQRRVRDTFTMPVDDYRLLAELKKRCRALGIGVKKSELLRAGLATIRELPDERLRDLVVPLTAARGVKKAQEKRRKAA